MAQHSEANYLHRMTPLFAIAKLGQVVPPDVVKSTFLPVLSTLYTDKVANIRMNVAKTIQEMNTNQKEVEIISSLKGILTVLSTDKDLDVQFFAQRAMKNLR